MSVKYRHRLAQGLLAVIALVCAPATIANTLCTHIVQSPEHPIPIDERESDRQVQARLLPSFVTEGDKLASAGNLVKAAEVYVKVLSGNFSYRGTYPGHARCLPTDFYQEVADKLRAVASQLAEQREANGYLLDEIHQYGGVLHHGALSLYLISNQYDIFVDQAIAYAESELRERDIDRELNSIVQRRLYDLRMKRKLSTRGRNEQYVNDLTPLLDSELAAFDKLSDFGARLAAHLEPLYPGLADQWLAEEVRYHKQFLATDAFFPQMALDAKARGSLQDGIDRLQDHPILLERLRARANERGEAFVAAGRYEMAEGYFDVAGNENQRARAEELADRQQAERVSEVTRGVEADIRKMQKSEDEKATFEQETEDMAAELDFDLDD